jgi:pimeloyl-ACP methyl ester carboxylesterase
VPTHGTPKTFVLVHGAWHGAWCWQRVSDLLTARGHTVLTPTLTGVGERAHLLDGTITLATHVSDVVDVIRQGNLSGVVLCGHSYGGFVISGVVEQVGERVDALVFLDAFVPANGQALIDITVKATHDAIVAAAQRGEIAVPPRPAAFFKVNEQDCAWVDAMCTPHPIATMTEKIALTGAVERIAKKAYVRAANYPNPGFDAALSAARANAGWRSYELPCGHDVMVDMPERLAEILEEVE